MFLLICGTQITKAITQSFFADKYVFDLKYTLIFICFIIFFFIMYDLYKANMEKVFDSAMSVGLSVFLSSLCAFLAIRIFRLSEHSITAAFIGFIIFELLLVPWRTISALLIKRFGVKKTTIIIEDMNTTSRLARKLKYARNNGKYAYYYMIDESNEAEVENLIENKLPLYDMIFISPHISQNTAQRIMSRAFMLHKDIGVLADVDGVSTMRGKIFQIDDTPIIEKKGLRMSKPQKFVKRSFDIVFALVVSIISAPVVLACAIAVKLDSPGPVLYKQLRYTRNKRVFNVYKFRTMVQDAEKNGAQLATEDDPRITKIGKFLRATRLDELPQIYNILMGSMSVVGPRPERPVFADEFSKKVNNYDMRYCVKAGLTGYAQVYGRYNTRVSDKILMDMIYIVNYSFMLDIKIVLLTIKTMFVKSSTEGVDEERDMELSSAENEIKRREETLNNIGE